MVSSYLQRIRARRRVIEVDFDTCWDLVEDGAYPEKMVNRLTKRPIKPGGPTCRKLLTKCTEKFPTQELYKSRLERYNKEYHAIQKRRYFEKNHIPGLTKYKHITVHYPKSKRKEKAPDGSLSSWQLFLRQMAETNRGADGSPIEKLSIQELSRRYREFNAMHPDATAEGRVLSIRNFYAQNIGDDADDYASRRRGAAGGASGSRDPGSLYRPALRNYIYDDAHAVHIPKQHDVMRHKETITLAEVLDIMKDEMTEHEGEEHDDSHGTIHNSSESDATNHANSQLLGERGESAAITTQNKVTVALQHEMTLMFELDFVPQQIKTSSLTRFPLKYIYKHFNKLEVQNKWNVLNCVALDIDLTPGEKRFFNDEWDSGAFAIEFRLMNNNPDQKLTVFFHYDNGSSGFVENNDPVVVRFCIPKFWNTADMYPDFDASEMSAYVYMAMVKFLTRMITAVMRNEAAAPVRKSPFEEDKTFEMSAGAQKRLEKETHDMSVDFRHDMYPIIFDDLIP